MPTTPTAAGFDEYVAARGLALLRFTYLLTGDYHLAEDLLQEALAKVHRRWSHLADAERPTAYVQKAILHQYLSWRRRRSSTETPIAEPPEHPTIDHAELFAERTQLWHALSALPRQQRAVLVLRFYEDLDDDEIARLVGCSVVTVRSHASRGLAALRNSVQFARGEAR
ncbi:SigE family RNA polymerase sigma factor [Cryptosporangium phraense]|uniref:SigE family RNA polymerase sigma factor n=1 Tax=Cryptosporangium phraense TaxID=2593070 RepID=A0A545AZJ7_9ACTN|nr:SigE family RNA polymerase sigma factor [Cryptosporangium phraense]TQS46035.1 SigE family RNA polymerase sigma factor [Cryptosporangium phraense]